MQACGRPRRRSFPSGTACAGGRGPDGGGAPLHRLCKHRGPGVGVLNPEPVLPRVMRLVLAMAAERCQVGAALLPEGLRWLPAAVRVSSIRAGI